MTKVQTKDHEVVSIYPFTEEETEQLMTNAVEAVLMWSTKDGWPIGVTHAFVWHEGKVWLTFTAQRHRAAAIRRDNRVSVNISSASYPEGADPSLPRGAITFKGRGEFFEDRATKEWLYTALSRKLNRGSPEGEAAFYSLLDSPLRILLAVTPEKRIMYNAGLAERHMAGTVDDTELGERLASDTARIDRERKARALD
jgi:general stress protein 26